MSVEKWTTERTMVEVTHRFPSNSGDFIEPGVYKALLSLHGDSPKAGTILVEDGKSAELGYPHRYISFDGARQGAIVTVWHRLSPLEQLAAQAE